MNCKPGDLAVIVDVGGHPLLKHLLGQIRRVRKLHQAWDGPAWSYYGKRIRSSMGDECIHYPDRWLKPLRDTTGADETLTWCPLDKPIKVE